MAQLFLHLSGVDRLAHNAPALFVHPLNQCLSCPMLRMFMSVSSSGFGPQLFERKSKGVSLAGVGIVVCPIVLMDLISWEVNGPSRRSQLSCVPYLIAIMYIQFCSFISSTMVDVELAEVSSAQLFGCLQAIGT